MIFCTSYSDPELGGIYYPLEGMTKDVQTHLIKDHFLFKEGDRFLQAANACRYWPTGRGIYHNDKRVNLTNIILLNKSFFIRLSLFGWMRRIIFELFLCKVEAMLDKCLSDWSKEWRQLRLRFHSLAMIVLVGSLSALRIWFDWVCYNILSFF